MAEARGEAGACWEQAASFVKKLACTVDHYRRYLETDRHAWKSLGWNWVALKGNLTWLTSRVEHGDTVDGVDCVGVVKKMTECAEVIGCFEDADPMDICREEIEEARKGPAFPSMNTRTDGVMEVWEGKAFPSMDFCYESWLRLVRSQAEPAEDTMSELDRKLVGRLSRRRDGSLWKPSTLR